MATNNDINKYVQLKTVVSFFLDQYDRNISEFDKCWIMAFRALVDIGFNISFEPLTVRLQVEKNLTAHFPPDYITWTKIGCINASGEVSPLKINKTLTRFKDSNPQRLSDIAPNVSDQDFSQFAISPYFFNYYFNNYYSPLFGIGNGLLQFGECTVDETNKLIMLSPSYPFSDVLLEYISSPKRNGDYQIETVCQEAVIAFIEWKLKLNSEQNYYARLTEARRKLDPVRLQIANQVIRENMGYKLKS